MFLVKIVILVFQLSNFSQWQQQIARYDLVCLINQMDETDMSVQIMSYCLLEALCLLH